MKEYTLTSDISKVVENLRQRYLLADYPHYAYVETVRRIVSACVDTIVEIGGQMNEWEDKASAAMCVAHASIKLMACIKQLEEMEETL